MKPNFVAAAILFLAAQSCAIGAGFLTFAMIGEINRRLPDSDRISYLFGHHTKYLKILREYRRLYPDGRMAYWCKVLTALGVILMVGVVCEVGFCQAFIDHLRQAGK